jgi:hypothetical protein
VRYRTDGRTCARASLRHAIDAGPAMTPPWIATARQPSGDVPARAAARIDNVRVGDADSVRGREFVALCAALRATGGLARGDELARWLEDRQRGDFVGLARLIAAGDVFSVAWQHSHWVPMFQFDLGDLSLRPAPRRVLAELPNKLDGWAIAAWFADPNPWLDKRRPVDLLEINLPAVLQAARADRFVATG